MKKSQYILLIFLLLLASCGHHKTNTDGPARKNPTGIPETPYVLEGDYTPDTGVLYKVIVEGDTCFVVVDSITDNQLHGHYWQLVSGSDCVERKEFTQDSHWKNKRKDATVYIYQEPEYHTANDSAFHIPSNKINITHDEEYGQALGLWCSLPGTEDQSYLEIITDGLLNSITKTTQSLKMDIYYPDVEGTSEYRRPLVVFFHGGAFYVGDKCDSLITGLCRHFASMGYVAVSANYRLGFLPAKSEITRTGYMALQDAHAAIRYMVDHAGQYGIDTSLIFVGGASAGAITALNLAFMRDNDRPKCVYDRSWRDLGRIASSGNSSHSTFRIKAIANMWGAVTSLRMLTNSKTDIISFHGDADKVVPYDNGYPFDDMSIKFGKRMFDRMYGSMQIDRRARELGLRSELHTFPGEGHSLHHYPDGTWNQKNYLFIRNHITDFFYEEIAGPETVIEEDRNDPRHFLFSNQNVSEVCWHVEGGFIVKLSEQGNDIWVVWDDSAPRHCLYASGLNPLEFGFNTKLEINTVKE